MDRTIADSRRRRTKLTSNGKCLTDHMRGQPRLLSSLQLECDEIGNSLLPYCLLIDS